MIVLRRIIRWLLAIIIAMYIISGFGITEFRVVESLTFGLLTKVLSFQVHEYLWLPLVVLLALHIYLSFRSRQRMG